MENVAAGAIPVVALGNDGDGLARTPAGMVFVPGTVPGDEILLASQTATHGTLGRVVSRPRACSTALPLFGSCGVAACSTWRCPPSWTGKPGGWSKHYAMRGLTPFPRHRPGRSAPWQAAGRSGLPPRGA
ncbi:hypothetical protein RAA17_19595 [Komagataeibacter rhaeticus]|nr:hypothetical protein [Komagataeibacter rhaeticus]